MNLETLVLEGRRLARPCVLLTDRGTGPAAAVWLPAGMPGEGDEWPEELWRITVDLSAVPNVPSPSPDARFMSVFTNEKDCITGRVAFAADLPASGVPLYAQSVEPLAPIDAVFALGSGVVQAWLAENNWTMGERYNTNFKGRALVDEYECIWQAEYPVYHDEAWAVLGGWHLPGADDDWHERIATPLAVWTLRDAEPWVEVFYDGPSHYSVIQRIT